MVLYPSLMAKRWLAESWQKIKIFPDLGHETCLHGAVKV